MTESSCEYRSVEVSEAADILCESKNILILFHVHPDGDAVGSAFALRAFVEHFGGQAWCVCADELPERFGFITEGVQDSTLVSSIPEGFVPDAIVSVDTASPSQLGALYEVYKDKIDLMIDRSAEMVSFAVNCALQSNIDPKILQSLI